MGNNRIVKMSFSGVDNFCELYQLLKERRLILKSFQGEMGEEVSVRMSVPGMSRQFQLECNVMWPLDKNDEKGGVWLEIRASSETALKELEHELSKSSEYRDRLGLASPALNCRDPETKVLVAIELLKYCQKRAMRKFAIDILVNSKGHSLKHIRQILDDPDSPWYLHRNALYILGLVGKGSTDRDLVEKFFSDPDPRVKKEALQAHTRLAGDNPGPGECANAC